MATILPFKGIRYNPEKIKDMSKVVAPPFDIISEGEKEKYYQLHPNNIIRLILGKDLPNDNDLVNKYTRAAKYFDAWRREKILIQETEPAIYIYDQEFTSHNKKYIRRGIISLVRLEDFENGKIYPHEQTLSGPREDRLRLMQSCHANFSQVLAFYEDEDSKMSKILYKASKGKSETSIAPESNFTDVFGVKNLLWVVKNKNIIRDISLLMKNKALFIADGHHRYETALFYSTLVKQDKEILKRIKQKQDSEYTDGNYPFDYIMMMYVSMDDPGLRVLASHRLVRNIEKFDPEKIKKSLNEAFEIDDMGKDCNIELLTQKLRENINIHAFILYIGEEEKKFYMLKLRNKTILDQIFRNEYSDWKSLDAGILHGIVFDRILGIKAENISKADYIGYVKSERDAIDSVNAGTYQLAFFLNPTRINQVRDVAIKRHKMPPKATYFYPKPFTGTVIRRIL